jgi:hypothetical protein
MVWLCYGVGALGQDLDYFKAELREKWWVFRCW